jgi:hypothetical protein
MQRRVRHHKSWGIILVVCSVLLLIVGPLASSSGFFGTEVCTFEAEAPGVVPSGTVCTMNVECGVGGLCVGGFCDGLPASRTISITSATCTLTPPSTIGKLLCSNLETAITPVGGSWDVTFASESGGVVPFTTDDISGMTMSPFFLCGLTHDVQTHTMTSQSFTYTPNNGNPNNGTLSGKSEDRIISLLSGSVEARADKTGTYQGTITDFTGTIPGTMTLNFVYDGQWVAKGFLGALSPMSLGVLATMLAAAGGSLLWRSRARSA